MNEGDKVVCVFVDGHYYAVPLSAPAEGDKVVCVPLEHGQIAVPSSAPAEGDHVLMVPNDMGQYIAVTGGGAGNIIGWGQDNVGQASPPRIIASNIVSVGQWSVALMPDGTLQGWGNTSYDPYGILSGLASKTDVVQIAAGPTHIVALQSDGTVVAWGRDDENQCSVPADLSDVVQVAAGTEYSVALKSDGTVVTWGDSIYGESWVVPSLSDIVQVCVGGSGDLGAFCYALESDGTVHVWGHYLWGEWSIPSGLVAVKVSAGKNHALALKADGSVVWWGGDKSYEGYNYDVPDGLVAIDVVARGRSSHALCADGTVVSWGADTYSLITDSPTRTDVIRLSQSNGGGYTMLGIVSGEVDPTIDYMAMLPSSWIVGYTIGGTEYTQTTSMRSASYRPNPTVLEGTSRYAGAAFWSGLGAVGGRITMKDLSLSYSGKRSYLRGWIGTYLSNSQPDDYVSIDIQTTVGSNSATSSSTRDADDYDYYGSSRKWQQFMIPLRPGGVEVEASEIDSIEISYILPSISTGDFILYLYGLQLV